MDAAGVIALGAEVFGATPAMGVTEGRMCVTAGFHVLGCAIGLETAVVLTGVSR